MSQKRELAHRLAETADRVEFETRRNRFFTLAPDMLGVAGFDGRLRQLNASWERTLGLSAQELSARPVFEFLHPDDRKATRDHLRDLSGALPRPASRTATGTATAHRWLS
jgi:PAS domain S-box-containing protein